MERLGDISTGKVRSVHPLCHGLRSDQVTRNWAGKNVSPKEEVIRGALKYSWAEGSS